MTNSILVKLAMLVLSSQLTTNVTSWDDGNAHVSKEWYYEYYREVPHPTEGLDTYTVKSNWVAHYICTDPPMTNEFVLDSRMILVRTISWKLETTKKFTTNQWAVPMKMGNSYGAVFFTNTGSFWLTNSTISNTWGWSNK